MIAFLRNAALRSIVLFARKMGAQIPPITLQTTGSIIPTESSTRISKGSKPVEPLMDLRNLFKEEVAMCNYLLKSTTLKSPTRR